MSVVPFPASAGSSTVEVLTARVTFLVSNSKELEPIDSVVSALKIMSAVLEHYQAWCESNRAPLLLPTGIDSGIRGNRCVVKVEFGEMGLGQSIVAHTLRAFNGAAAAVVLDRTLPIWSVESCIVGFAPR